MKGIFFNSKQVFAFTLVIVMAFFLVPCGAVASSSDNWALVSVNDNGVSLTISNLSNKGPDTRLDELFIKLGYSMTYYANGFEAVRGSHKYDMFDGRIAHNEVVVNARIVNENHIWWILRADISKLGITIREIGGAQSGSQSQVAQSSIDNVVPRPSNPDSYVSGGSSLLVVDPSSWTTQSFQQTPSEQSTPSQNLAVSGDYNGQGAYATSVDYSKILVSSLPRADLKATYIAYYEGIKNYWLSVAGDTSLSHQVRNDAFANWSAAYNAQTRVQAMNLSKFSGVVYLTPTYKPIGTNWSKQYARVMVENTSLSPMSQQQADERVQDLLKSKPVDRSYLADVPSFNALVRHLDNSGPLYAVYSGMFDEKSAEAGVRSERTAVIRGAVKAEGFPELVLITSLEGFAIYQPYDGEYALHGSLSWMQVRLEGVYKPNIFKV